MKMNHKDDIKAIINFINNKATLEELYWIEDNLYDTITSLEAAYDDNESIDLNVSI